MKKVLFIVGGIIIAIIAIFVIIFQSSEKMVCKSSQGDITLMYNEKSLVGYTALNLEYDFEGQKDYAEEIGIEAYLDEFATWFSSNTDGTCTR